MPTSDAQMRKINREVLWAGILWFIVGIVIAAGRKLNLYQPTHIDGEAWIAFGAFTVLAKFIVECTEVVLLRIQETVDGRKANAVRME